MVKGYKRIYGDTPENNGPLSSRLSRPMRWEAYFCHMFNMLLLAPSDSSYSTIPWHRVRNDTCTCFHCVSPIITPCRLGRLGLLPTGFSVCWMLQHGSSLARGSLTAVCLICSTLSYIGWTSINVSVELWVTIYRCLQNRVPQYLADCCMRTSDVSSRQRLRSANRRQLVVPRHRRSKFGRRTFSVAAPMVGNSFQNLLGTQRWASTTSDHVAH